jgi:hypothetical protein
VKERFNLSQGGKKDPAIKWTELRKQGKIPERWVKKRSSPALQRVLDEDDRPRLRDLLLHTLLVGVV